MNRIALFALLIVGGLFAATAEAAPRIVRSPNFNLYVGPRPYYVAPPVYTYPYVYPYTYPAYPYYRPYQPYYQPGFQFYYHR